MMKYILLLLTLILPFLAIADQSIARKYNNLSKPNRLVKQAIDFYMLSNNDEARKAYNEALVLFKIDLVKPMKGIGELERKLSNNEAARKAYNEALVLYRQVPQEST